MAVWYLDNDDEITDAVARLRGTSDEHVVFVVPPGSRIATGRINFRLLAREAEMRAKEMAIASPDDKVRSLATAAGVLAAASVDEAEAALQRGDRPPAPSASGGSDDVTGASPVAVPASADGERAGALVWRSQRLRLSVVVLLALALVGVFAASQLLPTAQITLQPRMSALGPVEVAVVALPAVTEVDAAGGRIPAVTLPIPLEVRGALAPAAARPWRPGPAARSSSHRPNSPTSS